VPAAESLIAALKDREKYVRWTATEALGNTRVVEPIVSASRTVTGW